MLIDFIIYYYQENGFSVNEDGITIPIIIEMNFIRKFDFHA